MRACILRPFERFALFLQLCDRNFDIAFLVAMQYQLYR